MSAATKVIIGVVLSLVLLISAILFMPLSPEIDTSALRSELASKSVLAVEYVGAAFLFLLSLKAYKTKMRRAFIILAVGILITAVGAVQVPLLSVLSLSDSLWAKSGMIILPFLLGGLGIYLGIRSFAQLVGIHTIFTKTAVVIPVAIIFSALSIFLPHVPSEAHEIEIDITNAIVLWTALLDLAAALLILQVKRRIGAHYIRAMAWLLLALAGSLVVLGVVFFQKLLTPGGEEGGIALETILAIIVGLLYLRAGYEFTKTKDY